MTSTFTIKTSAGVSFDAVLPPLESIRILGTVLGYYEVDCEPMGGEKYRVRARKEGADVLTINGNSWEECLDKFLARAA